jgi:AcrR family transcriptional regulator
MAVSERKRRESEALKRQILDIAEEIIAVEGVERVTMRRIAASVDYAPTVLYRLFGSKADLMEHLIARGYEGVRRRYADARLGNEGRPLATLRAILEVYVGYALDHPNHYRMWFDTGVASRVDGRMRMNHGRLEYVVFEAWCEAIAACQVEGLFVGREPVEIFQVLWARVHGLISLRLQHPDFPWLPLEQHLDEVLALPAGS